MRPTIPICPTLARAVPHHPGSRHAVPRPAAQRRLRPHSLSWCAGLLVAALFSTAACAQQQTPAAPPASDSGQQGYSFTFGPMNGPMMQGAIMFGQGRGMPGGGMMGQGMMGQGMMGQGMMGGADPLRHLEGRIAFVKTELDITQAQMRPWNAFADAWRASAKAWSEALRDMPGQTASGGQTGMSGQAGVMGSGGGGMMSGGMMYGAALALPDQIAWAEKQMSAQLEALRMMKAPAAQLYAALSDGQKQMAAALLHGPMGMPGMTGRW